MHLDFIDREDYGILTKPHVFNYRGILYVVPEGFVFNGANIPWWAWTITKLHPFHERVRRAALFHDFMYSMGYKAIGDMGFKSILKEDGCNTYQYMVCYLAVRLFGGSYVQQD